jgi:hypothetical protein
MIHILFPQSLQEKCLPKAVWKMLLKNFFTGQRFQGAVDLASLGSGEEEGGSRVDGDMLDMEDGKIVFSEVVEKASGFLGCLQDPRELHLAAGEVVVLKIHEQQSCCHRELLLKRFT